jgi:DNA-binding NarL/FixJ family response regulator
MPEKGQGQESKHRPRVILTRGVEVELFDEDSRLEIHRCDDVRHVAKFLEGSEAGVLLVDLDCLSDSEKANLRKQMAQFKVVHVVAIADSIDDGACEKMLRMGCVGSLQRRETPATIMRALKAVLAGELWFPRATLSRVLREFLIAQDPDRLTSRELEILALVGADLNTQQIADKLFISRETVRWHIKSLHAKLGTRTRRSLGDQIRLMNRLGKATPAKGGSGNNPKLIAS